jgi:hypothetical protein
MGRPKTVTTESISLSNTEISSSTENHNETIHKPKINEIEWTDYVLGLLSEDEKIGGNPTTDGLRRIFEIALNCTVIESTSIVVQTPDISNEKRATVVHTIGYYLNESNTAATPLNKRIISGSADVY